MAVAHLSLSGDFWHQLVTFGWDCRDVIVVSHSLKMSPRENGPVGDVSFRSADDPHAAIYTDHLSTRYDWGDVRGKTDRFIASYSPGTRHAAYFSSDGRTASLGRFPRDYGVHFVTSGLLFALAALLAWRRVRSEAPSNQTE